MITSPPVLQYFDSSKPCTRLVDASSKAMGAALLQDKSPIAYALKSLTASQQSYAQIEKVLAIVFGCQKFHDGSADVKLRQTTSLSRLFYPNDCMQPQQDFKE